MATDEASPPPCLAFEAVDERWAANVAEHLLRTHRGLPDPSLVVDDCWLADDLALYLRHRRGGTRLGVRFGRLGTDPTTETPPTDSAQEGVYLFHSLYDTPQEKKLTDALGYDWWGDDPVDTDWATAVERRRLRTFATALSSAHGDPSPTAVPDASEDRSP